MEPNISLGADPEFVILNDKGKPEPAFKWFGIKEDEKRDNAKKLAYRSFCFRDGYMLEVNDLYPETCREEIYGRITEALHFAQKRLPKGYTIQTRAAVEIDLDSLKDAPPDTQQFGCEPAWDAYTGNTKFLDLDGTRHPFRYAGGHIHFSSALNPVKAYAGSSYESSKPVPAHVKHILETPDTHPELVKLFDLYIGIPLTVLFRGGEQFLRRRYYGTAGEYRSQEYPNGAKGVEYRTPPSELWNHSGLVSLAYGVGRWVITYFPELLQKYPENEAKNIAVAINTGLDAERFLQTVPNFYTPDSIKSLCGVASIRSFQHYKYTLGWSEMADLYGIKVPRKTIQCPSCHKTEPMGRGSQWLMTAYCQYCAQFFDMEMN